MRDLPISRDALESVYYYIHTQNYLAEKTFMILLLK